MLYIPITNPSLENAQKTMLSKRQDVNDTVLNVYSGLGFSCNKVLLIGNYNEEIAEIVYTHASTPPTTTTITLASGLKFAIQLILLLEKCCMINSEYIVQMIMVKLLV